MGLFKIVLVRKPHMPLLLPVRVFDFVLLFCISQEIRKLMVLLQFKDCYTQISHVDAHATLGNGIVLQVLGELSSNGQPMRKFVQTIVLAAEVSVSPLSPTLPADVLEDISGNKL